MTLTFIPSTVPYFRAALIDALEARVGLAGVAICDGRPPADVLGSEEFVALMEATGETTVPVLDRTTQPRQEEYEQTIYVSVAGATSEDQVTLGERAFALLAEILDQLRATPHLEGYYPSGHGQIASAVAGAFTYSPHANDSQREATIEFQIRVVTRLQ